MSVHLLHHQSWRTTFAHRVILRWRTDRRQRFQPCRVQLLRSTKDNVEESSCRSRVFPQHDKDDNRHMFQGWYVWGARTSLWHYRVSGPFHTTHTYGGTVHLNDLLILMYTAVDKRRHFSTWKCKKEQSLTPTFVNALSITSRKS